MQSCQPVLLHVILYFFPVYLSCTLLQSDCLLYERTNPKAYLIDIPQCSKGTVRPDLGCEQGCY